MFVMCVALFVHSSIEGDNILGKKNNYVKIKALITDPAELDFLTMQQPFAVRMFGF